MSITAIAVTCLGTLLSEFSFNTEQQQAIIDFIELSNTQIPSQYTTTCSQETMSEELEWLVMTTQSKFFARTGERYNTRIPAWIENNSEQIIEVAESAGFISEVAPQKKEIDCIAILGATGTEMKKRISYVKSLIENRDIQTDNIFLLTGERYSLQDCDLEHKNYKSTKCFVQQDGGIDYITKLANQNNIKPESVTETHIMIDQFQKILGPHHVPIVIDTPKAKKTRPDTKDTVIHFINSKEYKNCAHTAFVSRAPNIRAQNTAIEKAYQVTQSTNSFETIGDKANPNEIADKASVAHHILMPIGGSLYGQYVNVCRKISIHQDRCNEEYLAKHLSFNVLKNKQDSAQATLKTPKEDL